MTLKALFICLTLHLKLKQWAKTIGPTIRVSARKKIMGGGTPARQRRALSRGSGLPQKFFISGPLEMLFPSI